MEASDGYHHDAEWCSGRCQGPPRAGVGARPRLESWPQRILLGEMRIGGGKHRCMATDFRSGKDFPRRGREEYGSLLWLLRVFDKARASANGTIHDYIYPCPMDQAVFQRWGITPDQFNAAITSNTTDEAILTWLQVHVSNAVREETNRWL